MQFSSLHRTINRQLASRGIKPNYIIGLDSATAALQATSKYLHGKEFRTGGIAPWLTAALLEAVNHLPAGVVEKISTWSGWADASSPSVVDRVEAETMSSWVANLYPKRRYPAVMIGSSNGAAVHLCAALGIPFLPQTLLVCLRHSVDRDDPTQALEWWKASAQRLLEKNPDLAVYQMHDANQDRLKVGHVTYYRLKRTRLGRKYKQFIQENIEPGGTIFLLECEYQWLFSQLGTRHLFQFGGKGKLNPQDYFQDSQEITDFLKRRGSKHRQWNLPAPDGWWPESEWGYDSALSQDIEEFAHEHGLRIRRIVFHDPQDLSPLVADLYRWWYQIRGLPTDRLFVESFTFLQPWCALRLGVVPYWAVFNDRTSLNLLNNYLDTAKPYDEIYANLFSNGLHALGMASIDQWQAMLNRARKHGQFIGVNEQKYPRDVASFIRHYTDLKKLKGRYPMPEPLQLHQLDAFLAQSGDRYPVRYLTMN
jgi:hypothetical protein